MGTADKVRTWAAVIGMALGLLAFFGITNLDQIKNAIEPRPSTSPAAPTYTPQAAPVFPTYTKPVVTPAPPKVLTVDPGCEAAISTMQSYTDLISLVDQSAQKAAAVTLNRQAADLEADVQAARTSKVRAAIKGLAAASRAKAAALPNNSPSDLDRWKAANGKFSAELDALKEGCSVLS